MTDKTQACIYTAALIIIGDEILSGRTHDKNTPYVAEKLNEAGVRLREVRVIPDDAKTIQETVNIMRETHDYVFTTGGIGPTHDDITAENVAVAFGVELELNEAAYADLLGYYKDESEITESRKKMAMIPVGADLIPNPVSGAPGIQLENVYVMAGVPRIMQAMFDHILPSLTGGAVVLSRSVTADIPESKVADGLGEIQKNYPDISIGSYPQYRNGRFGTSMVCRGTDEKLLNTVIEEITKLVHSLKD